MEIKHTIEILTKDIQDIEKLVGNLQNSEDGYAIELDLALSKLRNVYDILTMIKADRWNEMFSPPAEAIESTEFGKEPEQFSEPEQATEPEQTTEPEQVNEPEQITEPEQTTEPEQASELNSTIAPGEKKEAEILAEKFSAESSINENLAGQRGQDKQKPRQSWTFTAISGTIGINDRFLIIRELLNGDSERFNNLIKSLEGAGNYQDAINLLEEEFSGSVEHEGIEILAGLVKRRYTGE